MVPVLDSHREIDIWSCHYGVFNGRKWEQEIYPVVRNSILAMHRGRGAMSVQTVIARGRPHLCLDPAKVHARNRSRPTPRRALISWRQDPLIIA
ncbi:hypothetical protein QO034_19495 [Sedimentitalea sp. JM2-8]|uniref:Uncharacterized protein n=1 Tax=Sedimentitalea xiamensis TaxID=3050037 RepID=A0ABT7FK17_9RHOB|nr:hypothetical protein [Sedimentitalea xiamensis]MDK3075273.1 hypothetical protein [Sedimentitalea xiamensis]